MPAMKSKCLQPLSQADVEHLGNLLGVGFSQVSFHAVTSQFHANLRVGMTISSNKFLAAR